MILYLDTSALAKVYIREAFSEIVRAAFSRADIIAISSIGYIEFHSALSRLLREHQLTKYQVGKISISFKEHWSNFKIIEFDNKIIKRATQLLFKTELRFLDSLHLAAAETLKKYGNELKFGCFDNRLIIGAKQLGIELL